MTLNSIIAALVRRVTGSPSGPQIPKGAHIGERVHIGTDAQLDWSFGRHIYLDDEATIANGARILAHDASSYRRTGLTFVAPVHVGKRAFIGADSLLLPGVSVGDDAIVAAGAVVRDDVPAGTIVAGVPARVIGTVEELDDRRRQMLGSMRVLDFSVYGREEMDAEKERDLEEITQADGGYFLASSAKAAEFPHDRASS